LIESNQNTFEITTTMEGYARNVSDDGKLQLEVGLVKNAKEENDGILHVRVSAVEEAKRVPMNVICLLDTSGSMGVNVSIQNADGTKEETTLSVLDLAKHAVLTVANGLNNDLTREMLFKLIVDELESSDELFMLNIVRWDITTIDNELRFLLESSSNSAQMFHHIFDESFWSITFVPTEVASWRYF